MEKTYEFPLDDLELLKPDQEDDGEGEEGDGGEEGEGQPGDSKPGQGQGQGDDDNDEVDAADISGDDVDDDQFNDEMEKIFKDMEEILDEKEEATPEEIKDAAAKKPGKPTKSGGQNERASTAKKPIPEFSWEDILRRLLTAPSDVEKTYQKTSRRAASTMTAAGAGEPAYLPPGERAEEENFKVLFVFDSSGSMSGSIGKALSESENLIKQNYENIEGVVGVTFFANRPNYFAANLSKSIAYPVANLSEIANVDAANKSFPLSKLFNYQISGGTDFTKALASNLLNAASQGFNIILFTDTDVFMDNDNLANFKAVWKSHSQQLFVLLDSQYSFEYALKRLGLVNHPHFGIIGS
jgi:hypothetical protein